MRKSVKFEIEITRTTEVCPIQVTLTCEGKVVSMHAARSIESGLSTVAKIIPTYLELIDARI